MTTGSCHTPSKELYRPNLRPLSWCTKQKQQLVVLLIRVSTSRFKNKLSNILYITSPSYFMLTILCLKYEEQGREVGERNWRAKYTYLAISRPCQGGTLGWLCLAAGADNFLLQFIYNDLALQVLRNRPKPVRAPITLLYTQITDCL